MKSDLSTDRLTEAGVDVERIAQTSVLMKIDDVAPDNILQHPVFALCRGLAAVGFHSIHLCGAPNFFQELESIGDGIISQHPGLWGLEALASSLAPRTDMVVDLTNDVGSQQLCPKLSSDRSSHCIYVRTGHTWAAIGPSPITSEELGDVQVEFGTQEKPPLPISRIAAGLALQELVMYAGNVDLAAPLESTVIYDAAVVDGPNKVVEETWKSGMIEGTILDVVGAGGTGTFFLESILPMLGGNCSLFIYDFDKVGHENLYHGVYMTDDVGRDKAIVSAARIHHTRPDMRIIPLIMPYQERPNGAPKPTARILCVDNWQTRLFANRLSIADGVPLLECGSSPLAAQARIYVPGRSCCLECRIPKLPEQATREEHPASCSINPARTLPGVNMIISAILAIETARTLTSGRFGMPSEGTIMYDASVPERFGVLDARLACEHNSQARAEAERIRKDR
jgi:molybdopterin/thiamine biosynthesis adenylyltransferase